MSLVATKPRTPADHLLRVDRATKTFDGVHALENLSFELPGSEIVALIGPNGSGKTTLFNAISGFWRLDRGAIYFNGERIAGKPPHRIAALGVGRTFQTIRILPQISVLDNVLIALHNAHGDHLWRAVIGGKALARDIEANRLRALEHLTAVGLEHKAASEGAALSHGQRRLLELARILALDSKLILLDEPMAGLFPEMVQRVKELVATWKQEGKTILFIEHNIRFVMDISDRVLVLSHGELIADGSPEAVQGNPAVIDAYLGRRAGAR
jgi:ABC-type branched-subunit amino acid transport system ATPase component